MSESNFNYTTKDYTVKALKYGRDTYGETLRWLRSSGVKHDANSYNYETKVLTINGPKVLKFGDILLEREDGEFDIISEYAFNKTYRAILRD
jgi:hypothetical protein